MEQAKYDIFISYSRKNFRQVFEIVKHLSREGYNVWVDKDGIESGDAFKSVIVKAIKSSRVFMFFSSREANESPWTVKEVNMAVYLKKTIIPVKLDNADYNDSILFDLVGLDYVNYFANPSQSLQEIVRSLKKHLNDAGVDVKKLKEEIKV